MGWRVWLQKRYLEEDIWCEPKTKGGIARQSRCRWPRDRTTPFQKQLGTDEVSMRARVLHESPAAIMDMDVLPGVLGSWPL